MNNSKDSLQDLKTYEEELPCTVLKAIQETNGTLAKQEVLPDCIP
jgi:hypothetical protein